MGLMKKSKINSIRQDAARAHSEGRTIFVARFWDEVFTYQGTGSISGASEAIEEVESVGWILSQMAYSWVDKKNRGVTVIVFRKR